MDTHFSSGSVIIHFWDKPYQELNFKNHSNTTILSGKMMSDVHTPRLIFFILFVYTHFCNEIEIWQL